MRRTETQLAAIESAQARRRAGRDDLEQSIAADLEFHQAVMRAAGNPALARMFEPLQEVLQEGRRRTSQDTEARDRAIEAHDRILEAIRSRSPERARWAMHEHLVEGVTDLRANLESAGRAE
jgi:DNA-binding FadR family transcriptional regulator